MNETSSLQCQAVLIKQVFSLHTKSLHESIILNKFLYSDLYRVICQVKLKPYLSITSQISGRDYLSHLYEVNNYYKITNQKFI